MKKTIRTALVAGVAALALAFTGSAFASYAPKITVSSATARSGSGGGVSIDVRTAQTDDPTAQVTIYVPNGYQLNSPNPGANIGSVAATAQAADLGGAVLPLTGDLLVVDPKTYATQQAACGIATVAATWDLHLTAAGQTLDVPMFVVQTTGTETALGQFKLVVCLPPPDVPVGTPGRATFGAKLLSATFSASAFTNPPAAGEYRWRSVWTPYTPNVGKPNPAGTVEAQSLVRIPTQIAVVAKKKKVTKTVKGKKQVATAVGIGVALAENNAPIPGVRVTITVNGKKFGTATTTAKGTVGGALILRKGTIKITATAVVAARDLGAAGCTKTFAFACVDATVGGSTLTASTSVTAYRR